MNKIEVGTKVRWTSAAGELEGEVAKIWIGKNAAGGLVPWILIARPIKGRTLPDTTMLCATEDNLRMMRVEAA